MELSKSGKLSGWHSYPVDSWNKERPPNHVGDLPFWKYCADKYGDPILDLCCGNGRVAIPLAEAGYEVMGVDVNSDFVAFAQDRARKMSQPERPLKLSFHIQDIVELELQRTFQLAIIPDWSFQVLLTQEDQISFLKRLHGHLAPSGAFAFNLFIPFTRQRQHGGLIDRNGTWEWASDPSYHQGAHRTYDPVEQIETLPEPGVPTIRLRHTNLSELKLLFRLTGFELTELYGNDEDRRPFTGKGDDDYTIIAKRL